MALPRLQPDTLALTVRFFPFRERTPPWPNQMPSGNENIGARLIPGVAVPLGYDLDARCHI